MRRCGIGLAAALGFACWQGGFAGWQEANAAGLTASDRTWSLNVLLATPAQAEEKAGPTPETVPPLPVRKDAKGSATGNQAAVPEPDVWPASETAAAQARCTKILKDIGAVAVPQPPLKQGRCGTPAPIRLLSLGKKARVTFEPAALINCDMAAALSTWIGNHVQPLARKHLRARIATVEVMSDYSCRTAFGRVGHRLSQHAYADALDIRGFATDKGEKVHVLSFWGETQRDVDKRVMAAAPEAKTARINGQGEAATILLPVSRKAASKPMKLAASHLGGPEAQASAGGIGKPTRVAALSPQLPAQARPAEAPVPLKPESKFLRAAHAAACRIFGTTLGPEANEAHRNHFHVDMAVRKAKNYQHLCD